MSLREIGLCDQNVSIILGSLLNSHDWGTSIKNLMRENFHFDIEWDIHVSSKIYEENGYIYNGFCNPLALIV